MIMRRDGFQLPRGRYAGDADADADDSAGYGDVTASYSSAFHFSISGHLNTSRLQHGR